MGSASTTYRRNDGNTPGNEGREGKSPEQDRRELQARLQQDELAIAGDEKIEDLLVGVTGNQPLAHEQPKILGKIGV